MNLIDLKNNTKTIDLTPIIQNITELASRNGLDYDRIVQKNYNSNPQEYIIPTENGKLITKGLLKHEEVAVAISEADENTKFENHVHEEVEIIKIICGLIYVNIEGDTEKHTIEEGEIIIIPSFKVHDAYFPIKTKFIAITLPACDNWPEPEHKGI
jgi:quercetin dioxygenase-like cupin family protein